MAIVRWDAPQEMDTIRREMNQLFERSLPFSNLARLTPAIELSEQEESYTLLAELPGINKEDLDIQVTAKSVSIQGERKSEKQSSEKGVRYSEMQYGSFKRLVELPGRINHQNAVADYKDGVLTLTLPKADEEKNKVVKVQVG